MERPLCKCHGIPQHKSGIRTTGEINWRCAVRSAEGCLRWRTANAEKHRERSRLWRENNPEKYQEQQRQRHAREREKFLVDPGFAERRRIYWRSRQRRKTIEREEAKLVALGLV